MRRFDYSVTETGSPIEVPAHSSITIIVRPGAEADTIDLVFGVQNALVAPRTPLEISMSLPIAAHGD